MTSFDPESPASPDSGFFGMDVSPDDAALVLQSVPVDATTSARHGTADGPEAIRLASHQLDLFDPTLGRPYEKGIATLPASKTLRDLNTKARAAVDKARGLEPGPAHEGQVANINGLCQRMDRHVYEQAKIWLERGRRVAAVGGDHASVLGNILAHLNRYPRMAVLQIDAHADLRRAYEGFVWSHASVMYNLLETSKVRGIVQVGLRDFSESEYNLIQQSDRITAFLDATMAEQKLEGVPFAEICTAIIDALPSRVYVTLDIDGLDPTLCPHTGTPVPGGLSYHEVVYLLDAIAESGRNIVGFDLNEVAPGPEPFGIDAVVGARLLYRLCGLVLGEVRSAEETAPPEEYDEGTEITAPAPTVGRRPPPEETQRIPRLMPEREQTDPARFVPPRGLRDREQTDSTGETSERDEAEASNGGEPTEERPKNLDETEEA